MSPGTENREYADRMAWADDEIVIEQEPPPDDGPQVEQYAGLISSQLLDLAGGWHDAWEHERRAPDGRWVKGASDIADPMTDLPRIRNQVKAAQDRADADGRMDMYSFLGNAARLMDRAESGTNWSSQAANWVQQAAERARAYGDRKQYDQLRKLAHDTLMISTTPVAPDTPQAVATGLTDKAAGIVPDLLGGGHLAWDHKPVTLYPAEDNPYILAVSDWYGHISMQREYAQALADAMKNPDAEIANPDAFSVIDHELIHLDIPEGQRDRSGRDMKAYQQREYADIEEGFTELGSIQHAPEFFDRMGIGNCKTQITADNNEPNPKFTRGASSFAADLQKQWSKLAMDARQPQQQAAQHLGVVIEDLKHDPGEILEDDVKTVLSEIQHLGDPEMSQWAQKMKTRVYGLEITPYLRQATMSEYARRLQDPARIKSGDAWGHYPDQTAWAQEWVEMIARGEGKSGKAAQKRAVELADQVNREGTARKPDVMAEQLYAIIVKDAAKKDDLRIRSEILKTARATILRSWAMGLDPVAGVMREARSMAERVSA